MMFRIRTTASLAVWSLRSIILTRGQYTKICTEQSNHIGDPRTHTSIKYGEKVIMVESDSSLLQDGLSVLFSRWEKSRRVIIVNTNV